MTPDDLQRAEEILEMPPGPGREARVARLSEAQRRQIVEAAEVDELIAGSGGGAPPLALDPTAAMLGLVPDNAFRLDGGKLASRCKRAGIKPSVLAATLRRRGWDVTDAVVFRWIKGSTADVHPALIEAISESLSVTPKAITASSDSTKDVLVSKVTASPTFHALVARWAKSRRVAYDVAQSMLVSRILAAEHRGDFADPDQMLASLEALVAAFEAE